MRSSLFSLMMLTLPEGSYYLILRDTTMGILSMPSSDIKVTAILEPSNE